MKKGLKLALINGAIAGGISFFSGSIAAGQITLETFLISFSAAALIFLYKVRDYFAISESKNRKGSLLFEFA
jgi:hypothetical protein